MYTLRLTGSYLIAPARYANSAVWHALGYSPDSVDQVSDIGTASSCPETLPQLGSRHEAAASPGERDDADAQVVEALRVAMRDWGEASSAGSDCPSEAMDEADEPEGHPVSSGTSEQNDREDEDTLSSPADVPLPPSPPSSALAIEIPSSLPPPPPAHPSPSPSSPPQRSPARPLSSLSRLSRRATLCLSRLVDLEELDLTGPPPTEGDEPSEREKEVIARVVGDEVRRVREEVEGMVEEALRGDVAAQGLNRMEAPRGKDLCVRTAFAGEPADEEKDQPTNEVLTWFGTDAGKAFQRVDLSSDGVDTDEFLRAAESLVSLGELLAPAAASLCAGEFLADIGRVRARRLLHPARTATLAQLLESERRERRRLATEALEWLARLLGFTAQCLRLNLSSTPPEELSKSISTVWDSGFDRHFNWLVRPLFKVILRACPFRASVYAKLALSPGTRLVDVERELGAWLEGVERVVERVEGALERERRRRR